MTIEGRVAGLRFVRTLRDPLRSMAERASMHAVTIENSRPPARLDFDAFRRLATDSRLGEHERVGFPPEYREGKIEAIVSDILAKLAPIAPSGGVFLDIGPGCSALPRRIAEAHVAAGLRPVLVDSQEMLSALSPPPEVEAWDARFPDCPELLSRYAGRVDRMLAYSVLHYVIAAGGLAEFMDAALGLLAPRGRFLVGDVPSSSKRARFFASEAGREFHRRFSGSDEEPGCAVRVGADDIPDALLLGIVQRARSAGFDAYLLPQAPELPMSNRREDILIVRP